MPLPGENKHSRFQRTTSSGQVLAGLDSVRGSYHSTPRDLKSRGDSIRTHAASDRARYLCFRLPMISFAYDARNKGTIDSVLLD